MKFTELQKKAPADVQQELAKARAELMRLRTQVATGSAGKDAGRIRVLKRTVARIKTLQNKEVPSKR